MRFLGVLLALSLPALAVAEDGAIPPDSLNYCTTCHGVQMMGNETLKAPRLSAMPAWYVERQLLGFSKGWRGTHADDAEGLEMRPMAAALNDDGIRAAAEFVAATRSAPAERTLPGDPDGGALFYSTCSTCHGEQGEGNRQFGSPPLAGLNDWYLVAQLRKFRAGLRGAHPDDATGLQMKAATDILPDDAAIADVVAYITTLSTH